MKKKLLLIICFSLLGFIQAFAQNRTITGTVTSKGDGLPIPGATVKVSGTSTGTQTDVSGKFTINVPRGATLAISSISFVTQRIVIADQASINVALVAAATSLGEVVVTTSLGIKHSERELGYATARVSAKELTESNVTNIANGLTAKVAGLGVYTMDNGVDPQVAVVLRGNRSLAGNNNALLVVDGVPIPGGTLSSINPNDVADITILKGAGSAALYGSEASNGAILITTKRGTGDSKPTIVYGNSFQFEKVAFFPKLQTQFGTYGGEAGKYIDPNTGFALYVPYENQEYGPAYDGSTVQLGAPIGSATGPVQTVKYSPFPTSPIKAFFVTGFTEQNDISYSQGDAKNSFFMSAQNAYRTTVVPDDKNVKNAFSVRGHRTYGIFSADYSIGYTKTKIDSYNDVTTNGIIGSYVLTAGANDLYSSILQLPAFLDIKKYKDPDGFYGNPNDFYDAYAINPYWVIKHSRRNEQKDVILSQLKLRLDPTDWMGISYQISDNFGIYQDRAIKQEVDFSPYAISDFFSAANVPAGFPSGKSPGFVSDNYQFGDGAAPPNPLNNNNNGYSRLQGDAVLDLHHTFFKDFKTSLILGNTIREQYLKYQNTQSNNLLIKDFYNINTIAGSPSALEGEQTIRNIAYFGDLSIGYKNWLNLDATFRHEQDSRLSKAERNFTYPSAKLAFIPTSIVPFLKDNKILNYAKLYGSFSDVGNINIAPYQIQNINFVPAGFPYGSLGGLIPFTTNFSPTLKPELTRELEFGAELSFFDSRIGLNATVYKQNVKNQTVAISTSSSTGYTSSLINIGETESSGYELTLNADILTQVKNKFGLRIGGTFSDNNSKVISLLPGVSQLPLSGGQYAVVGQPFPLLKGTDFVRDPQGHVVVSATTGYPSNSQTLTTFGRTTPQYDLGLNLNLSYKFVSLSGVAEYRGGDVIFNGLGGALTFTGASATSASAGRERFIFPNSVIQTSPGVFTPNTSVSVANGNYGFWQSSVYSSTVAPFVSSGAFWKLREIDLAFNLDHLVANYKFIRGATFALTGRNLFILTPKSNPYSDPEFGGNVASSNLRGTNSTGQTPGTRVFGANLKLTF
jgi:TonB-linked SusC/RagA family outer membrane protein